MNEPFKQFLSLISRDEQYRHHQNQIKSIDKALTDIEEERDNLNTKLASSEEILNAAKKDLSAWELELTTLEDKEKDIKNKMSTSTSARDIKYLNHELANVAQSRERAEESLMDALNRHDNIKKKHQDIDLKVEESLVSLNSQMKQLVEQRNTEIKNLEKFKAEEAEIGESIPSEWLSLYYRVRDLIDDPVVFLSLDSCNGCGYTLTKSEVMALSKKQLMQCGNCYRILCYQR